VRARTRRNGRRAASLLALALAATACLNLEKSYPEKRFYVLEAERPGEAATAPPGAPTAEIRRLRISPRFADKGFVHRHGDGSFETDFYHEFLASPDLVLTEEARDWIARSGVFSVVVESASHLEAELVLEGSVGAIYVDHGGEAAPRAVLEMQWFLLRDGKDGIAVLLARDYRAAVAITGDDATDGAGSATAAVRGWNEALARILGTLEEDLRTAVVEKLDPDRDEN
jgi:hypothetical protein